jgi:hypothetical protein
VRAGKTWATVKLKGWGGGREKLEYGDLMNPSLIVREMVKIRS